MILFTITNTFAAKLFATKLSIMSCLFSHSLLNILAHLPPQYNCFEKCRGSWKNWRPGISYSNPIPVLIPVCEIANSGMGRELKKSIPTIREREGNEKNPFPQFGNGKGMKKTHSHNSGTGREWKKSIPEIREREGNEKIHSHNSGKGIRGFHSWEWTGTGIPAHPWLQRCIDSFLHAFTQNDKGAKGEHWNWKMSLQYWTDFSLWPS